MGAGWRCEATAACASTALPVRVAWVTGLSPNAFWAVPGSPFLAPWFAGGAYGVPAVLDKMS